MEDNSKSKTRPAKAVTGKANVIDLTPDMEIPEESSGKIIDLTNALHSPSAQPEQTGTAPSKPSKSDHTQKGRQDTAAEDITPAVVEEQVEAAFNAFQDATPSAAGQQEPAAVDERLQDLTQMAGNALHEAESKSETPPTPQPDSAQGKPDIEKAARAPEPQEPTPPLEQPIAELSGQPTELETSTSDFKNDAIDKADEAPIELTDIVDPDTLKTTDQTPRTEQDSDEDEVIDLTDMVNPAQLSTQAAEGEATPAEAGDDEIIELMDIVEPAELEPPTLSGDDGEEILELTDIVDPREAMSASEPSPTRSTERQNLQAEADDETHPRLHADRQRDTTAKENDQVIQLADVLNSARQNEQPRPDDITMDLDRDLMDDGLDFEQDDRAGALGMELVEESSEGSTAVADKEIEEAIERIIRTKYAQSIEKLIAQAVEKVVTREIKNIKQAIMDDSEPSP